MISFLLSMALLVAGYMVYGSLAAKVFKVNPKRKTPALLNADGVDYISMPWWKLFLIQFLNIAGVGPIFGAVMGVMYGPSAFLWIVFGTIFGGAVHDFFAGMLSIRQHGSSLTEIVGAQLGNGVKIVFTIFIIFLHILVGAVFIQSPSNLLHDIISVVPMWAWVALIFIYYLLATLLPIDKIIGRFYPIFGAMLLFMALGTLIMMLYHSIVSPDVRMPEVWDGLKSMHPKNLPVFPMMFISIACGAISGFHAAQSPLVARCMENEKYAVRIFYGAMILEGMVALIWAFAAATFFPNGIEGLLAYAGTGKDASAIVSTISVSWLGKVGGFIAVLGVIAAAVTSGDTIMRSARIIIADFAHIPQKKIKNRIFVALPIFAASAFILFCIDFDVLWRYFAWCNQTLSIFTLWTCTVYLCKAKKNYIMTIIPAMFMTAVCTTYILYAPEGFGVNYNISVVIGVLFAFFGLCLFAQWARFYKKHHNLI
ncbi:MAG: carbon starvation protein A [Bacteroidales bacterium]|nr:carbon starvation protein A [Bacteroidales bacterium]